MGNNGFGLDPQEYEKISNNEAYFRGRVVEQLNQVKAELEKQSKIDEKINEKFAELPCGQIKNKMKFAYFLIGVLFLLFTGKTSWPLIIKFFGL